MKTNTRMIHISSVTAELNDLVQELNTLTNRAKASAHKHFGNDDTDYMYMYCSGRADAFLSAQSKVLNSIVKLMNEVNDNEQD